MTHHRRSYSLASIALLTLSAFATAQAPSSPPDNTPDPFWEAVASYPDVKAKADADFARDTADAFAKRDAAFDQAYAAYQHDHARPAYDKWIAEAQKSLAHRLTPSADAWLNRMRGYYVTSTDKLLIPNSPGGTPATATDLAAARHSRLLDRARVGFNHQWTTDLTDFQRRLRQYSAFRPTEPADLSTLRASPAVFDSASAPAPATRPTTSPAISHPTRPTPVTLWVLDDDNSFSPTLYVNGRESSSYRDEIKRSTISAFLVRYEFQLFPTDVLTIGASDRKTGAITYLLADRENNLIAYSRAGLPSSPTPSAHDLDHTSRQSPDADWKPAVRAPGRDLRPLRAASSLSPPNDLAAIWTPSSKTGRCTILVLP